MIWLVRPGGGRGRKLKARQRWSFAIAITFRYPSCLRLSFSLASDSPLGNVKWHWSDGVQDLLWRKRTHCAGDRELNASEPVVQEDGMIERGNMIAEGRWAGGQWGVPRGGCKISFINGILRIYLRMPLRSPSSRLLLLHADGT